MLSVQTSEVDQAPAGPTSGIAHSSRAAAIEPQLWDEEVTAPRRTARQRKEPISVDIVIPAVRSKPPARKKPKAKPRPVVEDSIGQGVEERGLHVASEGHSVYSIYNGPKGPLRVHEALEEQDSVFQLPFWRPEESDAVVSFTFYIECT